MIAGGNKNIQKVSYKINDAISYWMQHICNKFLWSNRLFLSN